MAIVQKTPQSNGILLDIGIMVVVGVASRGFNAWHNRAKVE